ncbi:transposase family protein [Actinomyces gerencseriae]|uniref:transposase family protein n=1 Tax=Actinomyces gerencseriae TaxID=52769 RepID=UPI0028E6F904|nr:transposase family protein [Actinomyces gerencseriae]
MSYIGLGMITPKRKPLKLPLHPDDRAYNKTVNQVRYKIEKAVVNIKTWRVLRAGYRKPLETFPTTITVVLGIIFTYTP